jgi:hypothetical protein
VQTTFAGDALPGEDRPDHVVVHGLSSASDPWFGPGVGCAPRPSNVAASQAQFTIGAHEVAHTVGLPHVGGTHGEKHAEDWPYPHGTMSPDGIAVFGVVARPAGGGTWNLTLIDPCVGATSLGDRLANCMSIDVHTKTHDLMSYGVSMPGSAFIFGPYEFQWASDISYRRLYSKLATGTIAPPIGSLTRRAAANDPGSVEALIVTGTIEEDGATELLLPLVRKRLAASFLAAPQGPFTLELRDGAGAVLLSKAFGLEELPDETGGGFWLAVPHQPAATRLLVRRGQQVLLDRTASPNPPRVRVLEPNGGESFKKGTLTVRWEGDDADGDALSYLVQYSPDNGKSWQGITFAEAAPNEAEIPVSQLFPSESGIVRVTATDGFNTAVDESDAVFAIGKPKNAAGPNP